MVRPAGFEPTTPWFEAKYSNPLSYGRLTLLETNLRFLYYLSRTNAPVRYINSPSACLSSRGQNGIRFVRLLFSLGLQGKVQWIYFNRLDGK